MHKNDPYIMALAMSESNRRKEMRASGQGAMQEQPKVVDQMVAEMAPQQLPEDQGIGQLPAGEMNFAGGGIVAFADGGDVERYSGGGELLRTTTGGKSWFLDVPSTMRDPSVPYYREIPSPLAGLANKQFATKEEALAAYNQLAQPAAPAALKGTMPGPGYTRGAMEGDPRLNTPPSQPFVAAPTADTTRKGPRPAPTDKAAAPIPAAQTEGLGALDPNKLFATALAGASKEVRPEKEMLEALNAERKTAAESELSGVKALNEKFADAFKGRRERLDTREGAIGKMKDQNFGLALLQAGAAMMSTPGSLGTSIGRGIQSGSQQYVAGLDKINSAKDKLADARDRLDDLQLNRDEMSAREILKAEAKIRDTALAGQENMIKFVMERDKVNRETAMKIVDNQIRVSVSQAEISSRERISANENTAANARSAAQIAATLNTPDRILFDQLLKKNNNDAVKALEAFKTAKGDKFDVRSSYADYLKAFAGKEGLTPPMSMGAYAGQFGATLPR
jgi:hypothetical protein